MSTQNPQATLADLAFLTTNSQGSYLGDFVGGPTVGVRGDYARDSSNNIVYICTAPNTFLQTIGTDTDTGFATNTIALGTAAAAGVANTTIRSDSTIVAFDATNPTSSALGDAAAVGSATVAARRDHKHAREAQGTPAIVLGTANAAGVATTPLGSDATILAFDATTPATIGAGTGGAVGAATTAARRDHVHPVSMAVVKGHAASDVTLSTTVYTTVLTTGSLAIGTWMLQASSVVTNGNATAGTVEMSVIVGTATATFDGIQSTQGELPALSGGALQVEISPIVIVTVAGTLTIQVKAPGASASTAKALTPVTSSANATGYVAVQLA